MQSALKPEDIHAILSRFQSWAQKHPAESNGHGDRNGEAEQIREIPYEEAIHQYRRRRTAQNPKRPPSAGKSSTATSPAPVTDTPAASEASESLSRWIAALPEASPDEPVIELKAAEASIPSAEPLADAAEFAGALERAMASRERAKAAPPRRSATVRAPKIPATPEEVTKATLRELAPRAFVDLPLTPPVRRNRSRDSPAQATQNRDLPAQASPPGPAPPSKQFSPVRPDSAATEPAPRRSAGIHPPLQSSAKRALQPRNPMPAARTRGSVPSRAAAKRTVPQSAAKSAFIDPKPAILRPPMEPAPRMGFPPGARQRLAAAPVEKPKARKPAPAAFRRVLANTLQQPMAAPASRKKPARDRTRRITTRFTSGEERRIEKQAAECGITVSAYLRQCALAALAEPKRVPDEPTAAPVARERQMPGHAPRQPITYTAPSSSLLGSWLALLRNRFIGPPVTFSEDA